MSEQAAPTLSAAARSVLAERERHAVIGNTNDCDDTYVNDELSAAAACYVIHAGNPNVAVGSVAAWPWRPESFKPSANRRRDLVKAGAFVLAEIERLDRAPLVATTVKRDADGWWSHPDFLAEYGDDEINEEEFQSWCVRKQVETSITSMEGEATCEVFEAYMEDGQCDCSGWEIAPHPGVGWFIASIHDNEDGPVCVWARRVQA